MDENLILYLMGFIFFVFIFENIIFILIIRILKQKLRMIDQVITDTPSFIQCIIDTGGYDS